MNSDLSDIGAALSQSISKDGQTAFTNDQPMGNNKITGLAAGTISTDAANVGQVAGGTLNFGTATGTDTIAVTLTPGFTAYGPGQAFSFEVAATNTGPVTVNVNTIGAGALTWADGTALVAGDMPEGATVYIEVLDATPIFHLQTVTKPPLFRSGGSMTGAINGAKGADIASAATTDIGAMTGNYGDVTGTTTITGLGTVQAGTTRTVNFAGALTLTHHATSLILPGGANIVTAAGDVGEFISLGSGNWRCVSFSKASGAPVSMAPAANSLSANVTMNSAASYFTGPQVAQGTAGTWLAAGQVTIGGATFDANWHVKLWDGATVIASLNVAIGAASITSASLAGIIANPAGNIRISVRNTVSNDGLIMFNQSGNSKDSTITAIRIG